MAINHLAAEKELAREVIIDALEAALVSAYRRNFNANATDVTATIDPFTGDVRIYARKRVVEQVSDRRAEISLEDARRQDPTAELGGEILIESTPENFGRIAAQTAKQVIMQRIREAERDNVYTTYVEHVGELVSGYVQTVDYNTGNVTISLGKTEGLLMKEEQLPGERYRQGSRVRAYLMEVHRSNRGPVLKLSRTHRNMLRRLLEQEVPEIAQGTVEIKSIARGPGQRSKIAVSAMIPGVDPVGSCVGMRGMRIQNVVTELNGEKIDVVEWSSESRSFIANALSPAKVTDVILEDGAEGKTAIVIVPDKQLSLAIGKEGQNARLAAKLTGWRIDIKSEAEASAEGLDQLARDKAQLTAAAQADLLAVAEEILRQRSGEKNVSRVAVSQLAQALGGTSAARAMLDDLERDGPAADVEVPVELEAAVADAVEAEAAAEEVADQAEVTEPSDLAEVPAEELPTPPADEPDEEMLANLAEQTPEDIRAAIEARTAAGERQRVDEVELAAEDTAQLQREELEATVADGEVEAFEEDFDEDEDEELDSGQPKKRKKKRRLVYDEDLGEMVAVRVRKRGRRDWMEEDLEE